MRNFEVIKKRKLNEDKRNARRKKMTVTIGDYSTSIILLPILFPLILVLILRDCLESAIYKSLKWHPLLTNKAIDYYLYKNLKYDIDNDNYYIPYHSIYGFHHTKDYIFNRYACKFQTQLSHYLNDEYQKSGYNKIIDDDGYDKWIVFTPIKD